jgi:D-glycero-alpha-D-manno-heptose-7-phosphate kinase
VTLCNIFSTLKGQMMSKQQLAEAAYEIETKRLEAPIGKQDQYAAAFGGLNCFEFTADGVKVSPLKMNANTVRTFERRIMLFYTGATRQAREILAEQREKSEQRSGRTVEALHRIKDLGWQIKAAIEEGRLDDFGMMLHESWQHKKQLASGVTNSFIDQSYDAALAAGALGGKITGAGGGGFLMLYCHEDHQDAVRTALEELGLRQIRCAFEFEGTRVLLHTTLLNSPFNWSE